VLIWEFWQSYWNFWTNGYHRVMCDKPVTVT
jgi:hypothetical protein